MIETKLNKDQLLDIGWRIVKTFEEYSSSDPFGWDWPTMRMIFPNKCRVFDRLKTRYKELQNT